MAAVVDRRRCAPISRAIARRRSRATRGARAAARVRSRPLSLRCRAARRGRGRRRARTRLPRRSRCAPAYVDARIAAANSAIAAGELDAAVALCEEGLARRARASGALARARARAPRAPRRRQAAAEAFARALQLGPDRRRDALQPRRRAADAALVRRGGARLPARARVSPGPRRGAFQSRRAVPAAGDDRRGHRRVRRRAGRRPRATWRRTATSAKCCSPPGASMRSSRNFRRFEAHCPDALPLAVQALEVCQYLGDFAKLERYLDGLRAGALRRAQRGRARRCAGGAPLPAALFRRRAGAARAFRADVRRDGARMLRRAGAACRRAPAGPRAHRLPVRRLCAIT